MKHASILLALGTALAFVSTSLFAADASAAAGKDKAAACFACHGEDGNGIDRCYPRLAGQYNLYLQRALHEYKSGARSNPIMTGMASTLSDQDIADISAYFSALPSRLTTLKGHLSGD